MKRFIKSNVKIFVVVIISCIVFTCIGAYASIQYIAKNISFVPRNGEFRVSNVEEALNTLYDLTLENLDFTNSYNVNRSQAIIPSGILEVYVFFSDGTNDVPLTLNISGDIVENIEKVNVFSDVDKYTYNLRSSLSIYKISLTGESGNINYSVSGGKGTYRAWTIATIGKKQTVS